MTIFPRAVSSPSIHAGLYISPVALNSRSFGSEMTGKLRKCHATLVTQTAVYMFGCVHVHQTSY